MRKSLKGLLKDKGGMPARLAELDREIHDYEEAMKRVSEDFRNLGCEFISLEIQRHHLRWRMKAAAKEWLGTKHYNAYLSDLTSDQGRKMLKLIESKSPRMLETVKGYEVLRRMLNEKYRVCMESRRRLSDVHDGFNFLSLEQQHYEYAAQKLSHLHIGAESI